MGVQRRVPDQILRQCRGLQELDCEQHPREDQALIVGLPSHAHVSSFTCSASLPCVVIAPFRSSIATSRRDGSLPLFPCHIARRRSRARLKHPDTGVKVLQTWSMVRREVGKGFGRDRGGEHIPPTNRTSMRDPSNAMGSRALAVSKDAFQPVVQPP
jgi:hypothetical protein